MAISCLFPLPFCPNPSMPHPVFQCLQLSLPYPPGFFAVLLLSTLPSPFPISTCFFSVSEPNVPSYKEGAHDSSFQDTKTQNIRLVTCLHCHLPINLYFRTNLPILFPRICILVSEDYIHIFVLIHVWHICKLTSNLNLCLLMPANVYIWTCVCCACVCCVCSCAQTHAQKQTYTYTYIKKKSHTQKSPRTHARISK